MSFATVLYLVALSHLFYVLRIGFKTTQNFPLIKIL